MALADAAPRRFSPLAWLPAKRKRPPARPRPREDVAQEALARLSGQGPAEGPFALVAKLFITVTIALVAGIGSAYLAVDRGRLFNAVQLGQWTAYPSAGTPDADPYSAATLARTGQVPLGAGEGLAFFAEHDSEGNALTGACDYRIAGDTPPARLWTLTATDTAGRLIENSAGRQSLDSKALLRNTDGSFSVSVSRYARPGNWLPLGEARRVVFVLRLYDTPLTTGTGLADLEMPEINRGDCR
ncbi:DUF1214 domain-containing protein [Breoghania sp. L-A4]|uniref:DUF1214 domain-containing protein n=1 Tax=Breoghania sp. L-A4 TaxID=2304600 RepID=UPI000E35A3BB|nr:DUF1214 domain-containing protein [Breoghania sp. L-A4]AXS39950.1 DUF1214 domain-containing protein [Breoghania sp. L-A4]